MSLFLSVKIFKSPFAVLLIVLIESYIISSLPYPQYHVTQPAVNFNRDYFMVHFDPRPYNGQHGEVNETELVSMVKLVSTRFSRLLIDPLQGDNRNISGIVNAVAKFNKFNRTKPSDSPTQLWLQIPYVSHHEDHENSSLKYLESVKNTVDAANNIFPGSVEGLILTSDYFLFPSNSSISHGNVKNISKIFRNETRFRYKIALLFPDRRTFSNKTHYEAMATVLTNISACCVVTFANPTSQDVINGVNATILKYQSILENTRKEITGLNSTKNIIPIFRTGYPDTSNNSKTRNLYGDLVQYWKSMNEWAIRSNSTVGLTEAFDVPARRSLASQSLGWWKLSVKDAEDEEDDPGESFVEKISIPLESQQAERIMEHESTVEFNMTNYFLREENFNFRSNPRFSVHFNPYKMTAGVEAKFSKLLEKVSEKFASLSIRSDDFSDEEFARFPEALARWNIKRAEAGQSTMETCLTFPAPSLEEREKVFSQVKNVTVSANNLHPVTVPTLLISFSKNFDQRNMPTYFGILALAVDRLQGEVVSSNLTYQFGVELPLHTCKVKKFGVVIQPMLSLPKIDYVTLKYVSTQADLNMGVVKAMDKMTRTFETCRKRIENLHTNRTGKAQAVFSVAWQDANENGTKDYESFVRFWGEMGAWARKENVSLVISEAFDNPGGGEDGEHFGWWEVVKKRKVGGGDNLDYDFVEKRNLLLGELPPVEPTTEDEQEAVTSTSEITAVSEEGEVITEQSILDRTGNGGGDGGGMDEQDMWFWIYYCGVPSSCFIVIGSIIAILVVWKVRRSRRELTGEEVKEFFEGSRRFGDNLGEELYINSKYNSELNEIPLQNIAFDSVIGSGKFAISYKATLADSVVTVKVPKKACPKMYFKSMLTDVKIMGNVGDHVNVLRFHGAHTKDVKKGMVYIITEYCANGTLYAYLRTLRYNLEAAEEETAKKLESVYDLHRFAYEIASGMYYLSEKDVIHGDLSTSNVLLDGGNVCKICNYGLSRKLDENGDYLKRREESFPWRWIAVESLKHKIITSRSDVWSFGVTLWEIFSLGRIPYKSHAGLEGFLEKLEKGLRLKRPKYATQDVYDNMMQCWSKNPADRPQFLEQAEYFQLLMKEEYDQFDPNI